MKVKKQSIAVDIHSSTRCCCSWRRDVQPSLKTVSIEARKSTFVLSSCRRVVETRGEEVDPPVVVDGTVVADSVSEGVLARSPLSTRSDSSAKSSTSVGTAVGVQQEPQRSPSSKCWGTRRTRCQNTAAGEFGVLVFQ